MEDFRVGRGGSVTVAVHCSGSIRPSISAARLSSAGVSRWALRATVGKQRRRVDRLGGPAKRVAKLGRRHALGEQLPGPAVALVGRERARHEVAGASQAGERLGPASVHTRERVHLGEHLAGRCAGHVRSGDRGDGGGQRSHVLGRAGELHAGHVAGGGHLEARGGQGVSELAGEAAIDRGEHHRCAVLEHVGRVGRAPHGGDGARRTALRHERRRQRAERRHEALGEDQDAGPAGDVLAVGGHHRGERPGGDGQADQVVGAELELAGRGDVHGVGQFDARQMVVVDAAGRERMRLLARVRAQLDVEPRPRQQHRQACAGGAATDDRRAPDRRHAAEPLPLEHHHRPDPVGDRAGERRRGVLDLREVEGSPGPDAHLARPDPPAPADVLGADDRNRDDRRAGLERQAPDAPPGPAERAGTRARALGEHQHDLASVEDRLGRLDRLLIAGAPVDRERAQRVQQPAQDPAVAEQLLLGHVVHGPPGHRADHERVEEAPVVGGENDRPLRRDVLPADPLHPQVDQKERRQDQPDDEQHHPIDALLPGPAVQRFVIHRTWRTHSSPARYSWPP